MLVVSKTGSSEALVRWSEKGPFRTALVCIPWAGAGAAPFRSWPRVMGAAAAVYGVRLAGRESRFAEPLAEVFDIVVDELVEEIAHLSERRIVIFGHCSGAILAFEIARALSNSTSPPETVQLIVASQLPPNDQAEGGSDPGHDLARYLPIELSTAPELIELLVPIIEADVRLLASYTYRTSPMLEVPLLVIRGANDLLIRSKNLDGWRLATTGPTIFCELSDSDHLFTGNAWPALAAEVRKAIL